MIETRDFRWEGHVKGINNLAGSMLASGKTPDEVLKALPALAIIVREIDEHAKYEKTPSKNL